MTTFEKTDLAGVEHIWMAGFNAAVYDTIFGASYDSIEELGFYGPEDDISLQTFDIAQAARSFSGNPSERRNNACKYYDGYHAGTLAVSLSTGEVEHV